MTSSKTRPTRAAKTAALKKPLWLEGKAPSSKSGTQKRQRSPDTSASAGTKKTCYTQAVTNKPLPKSSSVDAVTEKKSPPATSHRDPVDVNLDSDQDYSDDDESDNGGNGNNEQVAHGSSTESDSGAESGEDLRGLDPKAAHAMLEKENVEWGANADAPITPPAKPSASSTGRHDTDNTKLRANVKRVADRLAEAPQWINAGNTDSGDSDPANSDSDAGQVNVYSSDGDESDTGRDVDSTSQGLGTPFSSEDDEEQNECFGPIPSNVNEGWGPECHYLPPGYGTSLIKLTTQPQNLKTLIKVAIDQVMADTLHEFAYCPIDKLVGYNRWVLYKTAKSLNLIPYAKHFNQDVVFTRNIACVLNGRVSNYRGQVKKNAANKVEGYYDLLDADGHVLKVASLLQKSMYIYPMKKISGHENPKIILAKPFFHPAIIAVLRETYFPSVRGGSFGTKYHQFFKSSIPEHSTELEIPVAMLALVATSIHSSLDDYATGVCRRGEFNADIYEDIYHNHVLFLRHIREGSAAKYHRMMADLYIQASSMCILLHTATVVNEAIAQLDFDGMDE